MRARPLIYCTPFAAISLFAITKLQYELNFHVLLFIFSISLCAIAVSLPYPKLCNALIYLAVVVFTLTYFSAYQIFFVKPVQALDSKTHEVTATLKTDAALYENSARADMLISIDGMMPFRAKCYLPLTNEPLKAGTKIRVQANFYKPKAANGFDSASYQAGNGNYIAASYEKNEDDTPVLFEVLDSDADNLLYFPQNFSRKIKEAAQQIFSSNQAGLLNALLLGDKSGLDNKDYTALQKSGMSHMVAVSGLHISFLIGFCIFVFGRKWGSIIGVFIILIFIPIAGATPSVIRSAIMFFITVSGFLFGKQTDSLNSLSIALLILLFRNPYAILSLSLQLSFASSLGLLLFSGPLMKILLKVFSPKHKIAKKIWYVFLASVSCSVSSLICTAPILFSSFGYVSVLSLISNLCVIGVTAICFVGGIICCFTYFFAPNISAVFAEIIARFLDYMLWVAHSVSDFPIGVIHWGDKFGLVCLVLFSVLIFLLIYCYKKVKWKIILPIFCICIIATTFLGVYYSRNEISITYFPCGTGNTILVSSATDGLVLIDCAGKSKNQDITEEISEWMQWNNFNRIDAVILTAIDQSHARNIDTVLSNFEVGEIFIADKAKKIKTNSEIFDTLENCSVKVTTVSQRESLSYLPLEFFLVCDGKLGVYIDKETLILHSPTVKQVNEYLQKNTLTAKTLVLSQKILSDEQYDKIITEINPKEIIVQANTEIAVKIDDISIRTPYKEGEITQILQKR